jgi:hypothetical protein
MMTRLPQPEEAVPNSLFAIILKKVEINSIMGATRGRSLIEVFSLAFWCL